MSIDNRITILLTLRGRQLFTLRWLWHANCISLPFRIFVADGDPHPLIARSIEAGSAFPRLAIEYRRYDDRTYADYYRKLQDALRRIDTTYVMLADNDDFVFPTGVSHSRAFLDSAADYVCAGGGIAHFELRRSPTEPLPLLGPVARHWYQQSRPYRSYDIDDASPGARALRVHAGRLTMHYNLCRVDALRQIIDDLIAHDFTRLESGELLWKLRMATLGKMKSDASHIAYARQMGTSTNPNRDTDFIRILSGERYLAEMQQVLAFISLISSEGDVTADKRLQEELAVHSAEQLRNELRAILGWKALLKGRAKALAPDLVKALLVVGERIRSGKSSAAGGRAVSRSQIWRILAHSGAAADTLAEQSREWSDMVTTLQSNELRAFIAQHAPALAATPARSNDLAGSVA